MNRELELDLAEMGLSDVAAALRAAPEARVAPDFAAGVLCAIRAEAVRTAGGPQGCRRRLFAVASAVAAALAVCLAVGPLFFRAESAASRATDRLLAAQRADGTFSSSSAAAYAQAFAVTALARTGAAHAAALTRAVEALVRDQDAAGGWANDDLSARNVAALRLAAEAGVVPARRAYKQGLRYLRTHGLAERSSADLAREAGQAAARLGFGADAGLVCSLTLCAAG